MRPAGRSRRGLPAHPGCRSSLFRVLEAFGWSLALGCEGEVLPVEQVFDPVRFPGGLGHAAARALVDGRLATRHLFRVHADETLRSGDRYVLPAVAVQVA